MENSVYYTGFRVWNIEPTWKTVYRTRGSGYRRWNQRGIGFSRYWKREFWVWETGDEGMEHGVRGLGHRLCFIYWTHGKKKTPFAEWNE